MPPEHVCRVIDAFVGWLDLVALGFIKARPKATGRPPYDPSDLLKLYLYGYLHRVRSSRRLESECQRNIEVMWLLNRLAPDHKTIADFRRHNGQALRAAGAAFVRFCRGAGLVKGDWVAIDGSKFQAVASSKAVLHRDQLVHEQRRLEQRMAEYLQGLDEADVQEARPALESQAVQAALALLQKDRAALSHALGLMDALGKDTVVRGEPEARPMKGHGPAYNLQTAVDAEHALIISHALINEANDGRCLQPMAEAAAVTLDTDSLNIVADAGYSNGEQAAALEARGMLVHAPANRGVNNQGMGQLHGREQFIYHADADALTCPAGKWLRRKQIHRKDRIVIYAAAARDFGHCSLKSQCTTGERRFVSRHLHEEALQRMHARATPTAMRLRRSTVEHPFATLKFTILEKPRLLLRGLWGGGTEMALATLAYNLKRAMKVLGQGELQARLMMA